MTMVSIEETPAYIARCRGCGAIIMATVDNPDHAKDVAQDVYEGIRRGFIIERVTVGYVHENWSSPCKCAKPVKEVE